ncbi:MAG: uracil-DNA glycosylase [Rhodospirillaceae bacterium]
MPAGFAEPPRDCGKCPRLAGFRRDNRKSFADWHNAPVPAFGPLDARLLVIGLAPGLRGANRTGRPFTGDYAGDLLYPTLAEFGWTRGDYGGDVDDGLSLDGCRITNAVRCVPPENKPVGSETRACRGYLVDEIAALPNLRVIVALGGLAHGSILSALGLRKKDFPFAHEAVHDIGPGGAAGAGRRLIDSYHCSRYNTNTGRLTPDMFRNVFRRVSAVLRP